MINLKIIFQKNTRIYGIIIIALFSLTLALFNFLKCTNEMIYNYSLKEVYRETFIKYKDSSNVSDIHKEYKDKIDKIEFDEENDFYYILFKKTSFRDSYIDKYNDNIYSFRAEDFRENQEFGNIKLISKVLFYTSVILLFILVIMFSINIIYNLEKDISLYKLLGFNKYKITLNVLLSLYIYYFILYLCSILIINLIFKIPLLHIDIFKISLMNLLEFNDYSKIWIYISFMVILSFIRIIYVMSKYSPINLMKNY